MMYRVFNTMNFWVAFLSVISLVWYHGYGHSSNDHLLHEYWLMFALGYFTVQFAYRAKMSLDPIGFLRSNWLETSFYVLLFAFLGAIALSRIGVFGAESGMTAGMQRLSAHLFLLLISGVEMIAATSRSTVWKLPVPVLLITSYVIIILAGSVILSLPMMVHEHVGSDYFQALFTSVSASCVTGLVTVNISEYYTTTGQAVILILMQLGGLNIVAFATYFIARFSNVDRETLHGEAVKEVLSVDTFSGAKKLLQRVIGVALTIELLGVVMIYRFSDYLPHSFERAFHSVFHSVSAFNNAGFTIIDGGLASSQVQSLWPFHMSIATLIILGGLGFATLIQIARSFVLKSKSEEMSINTKVSLRMTGLLTTFGLLIFFMAEWDGDQPIFEQFGHAFFQSVTARTAGFNTLSIGGLGTISLVLLMVLMFIGASPGSTGGGIKTTTLLALAAKLFNRESSVGKHTVRKAWNVVTVGFGVVSIGTVLIFFNEDNFTLVQVLFEQVSAFGTVGLSTGITPQLGKTSLSVLMVTMFIGRVGPLALAYSVIGTDRIDTHHEETLIIG